MRPLAVILGFLLLLSLVAQLFGGPVSSGPYYAGIILWLPAMAIQSFISLFGVHIPQLLTFAQLQALMFLIFLLGGIVLFFGGLLSNSKAKRGRSTRF